MRKNNVIINTIIFVVIIIFLNLVSVSIFGRLDLTKGKIYALSHSSKDAVRNLEDRMVVKAYFSKNLPGEYADTRRIVQDKLSEYQAYSKGKLRFEFIDPADEEELKAEAQKNQIYPASMRVAENDKLEIREVYMGLAFLYQGQTESIPLIQNTRGLEYDITKTIKKITSAGLKKVALFTLEPEIPPQMQGYQQAKSVHQSIRDMISDSYELSVTDLNEPLENVEALIFTGIEDSLSQMQLFNLDQFLMQDGNVIMFQDRVFADIQNQKAEPIKSNLFDMLAHYGINLKVDLITDADCGQVNLQQQRGLFRMSTPVSYPFLPIIHNVNKDNVIVKNIEQMQLIFASQIDTTKTGNLHFEPLLYTSHNSGLVQFPQLDISLDKYMNKNLKGMFLDGPYIVGGIYTGPLTSYFNSGMGKADALTASSNSRILLVTDSDFIKDGAGAGAQGNLEFTMNAVDYMVSESALIEIRSREVDYKPLKEISSGAKKVVRWLNILLPSILLILLGIIRYRQELQRRKFLGELYE
ncbi:MAG: GldG family protein [Candidatus Cloacimonadales bacterium]|nr:GldG family protein [Candidatus Cloacimonadales bacterium]